jgi:hypothetical protein
VVFLHSPFAPNHFLRFPIEVLTHASSCGHHCHVACISAADVNRLGIAQTQNPTDSTTPPVTSFPEIFLELAKDVRHPIHPSTLSHSTTTPYSVSWHLFGIAVEKFKFTCSMVDLPQLAFRFPRNRERERESDRMVSQLSTDRHLAPDASTSHSLTPIFRNLRLQDKKSVLIYCFVNPQVSALYLSVGQQLEAW